MVNLLISKQEYQSWDGETVTNWYFNEIVKEAMSGFKAGMGIGIEYVSEWAPMLLIEPNYWDNELGDGSWVWVDVNPKDPERGNYGTWYSGTYVVYSYDEIQDRYTTKNNEAATDEDENTKKSPIEHLKESGKVTLLGRTSAGGSCSVLNASTAWGTSFQIFCPMRVSFLKNGSFYDLDRGAEPDAVLASPAKYYDRQALTEYINSLY